MKYPIISGSKDKGAAFRGENINPVNIKEVEQSEATIKPFKGKQKVELECEMCDYKCKKENTMKKHVNIKHIKQKCKTCHRVFSINNGSLNANCK